MQKNSRQAKNLQIVWSWGFHHTGIVRIWCAGSGKCTGRPWSRCVGGDNEKLADHIARAKEMKPSVLFLSYGMNDVGAQNGDADGFIKAYRPVIRDLKNHCRIRKYMLTVYFRQRRLQLIRILSMQKFRSSIRN